jgi:hypothetical protein
MTTQDVNDFLNGGSSAPSISWVGVPEGHTISGTVVRSEVTAQRDINTGNVKTWDDGNPMKQLVVTLSNKEWADPENPDGERRLFAKGSRKPESKSMLAAISEALKKAGAKLEAGGTLTIKYLGEGEVTKRGFNAPKLYAAKYDKPAFNPDEAW